MKKLLTIFFLLQFIFGYTQYIEGDCENGTGTYKYEDGTILEGNWNGGLLNGKGEITYKSGNIFKGEFGNKFKETVLLTKSKVKSDMSWSDALKITVLNILNDDYNVHGISTVAGGTIRCVKD